VTDLARSASPFNPIASALADRYRVERELGAGGMATVYLAHDLRHDRKVALKVLKPELSAVLGADRFVIEIKTTASLQHPHILPLFDSGTADGFLYYVMPYVEGETLRDKLRRETQLGIEEAIRITTDIADALDYAHRHGVIHRDIKPENILLHDGRPVVADFGIALAVSAAAGGRMTETGLSLGTPHYMSPEQATADKEISARSDIYSLGSVLYEMLAGEPPHLGNSAQQIIMKIISDQAQPVTKLRKSVPAHVAAAVAKSLEKLPADRFARASTFATALRDPSVMAPTLGVATSGQSTRAGVPRSLFAATAAAAVLAAAGFAWSRSQSPVPQDEPVMRVRIDLPPGERLWMATTKTIAISRQGDRLVYVAQGNAGAHMMVRRTSELNARELMWGAAVQPTFSPDGRWIVYADGNAISKVAVDGGASVTLASQPGLVIRQISWTDGDTLLVGSDRGLFTLPAIGGRLSRVAGVDSTTGAHSAVLLPDHGTVVFASGGPIAARRLALTSLTSGTTAVFDVAATTVLGFREGHLLYVTTSGELNAVPVDVERQRLLGDPVQLESGIRISSTGIALASLSENGSLFYIGGQAIGQLVRVGANGVETALLNEQRVFRAPRFSPDGRRIAVEVIGAGGSNIWVYDVVSGTFTPVTTDGGYANSTPEWSADGKRVVFRSTRDARVGVWWQPADGSGTAELLHQPDHPINELVMSPDGKWLLYRTSPGLQMRDIFAVPLSGEGDRKPILLVGGPSQESHGRLSPNGKWLAYQSNESGRFEVYVRPFPSAGPRVPVSNQGGAEPVWARTGNTIFYRTLSGGVEAAAVTAGATFVVSQRRTVLPAVDYLNDVSHTGFDVWPDGSGFLMVKPGGGEVRPILVLNWGREVREKLTVRRQ
jgi:Tol biopolymer transport system component